MIIFRRVLRERAFGLAGKDREAGGIGLVNDCRAWRTGVAIT
jgi:hypothetical protein